MKAITNHISKALTALSCMAIGAFSFGQNNTPCGGGGAPNIPINASCVFQTASTVGATQQTNNNNGGTPSCGAIGPDAWYTFTAPANGDVLIQTQAGSITDGVMAVYSGTCGPVNLTEVACNDDGGPGLMPELNLTGLVPGDTYFVRIWQFGGGTGTMDICLSSTATAPPVTAGNTPCAAGTISVNAACNFSSITTVGATQQTNPANGGTPSCGAIGPDVWIEFTAPATGSVDILTQAGSITDAVMAIYDGPCTSPTEISCNDDGGPGFMPQLSVTGLTPGNTYYIRIWQFGGGTGTLDICVQETNNVAPTNVTCSTPDAICSGSPIQFTAQANGTQASVVNPGNNYDCLTTSPNPSWYYLEIDQGGDLIIDITAGQDVDYAIWGPYTDLADAIANCDSYPVPQDCSFSPSAVEQAIVNGVNPGEVYVLLVTNFANTVQMISINEAAANTASTDCSIVPLPVEFANFMGGWNANNEVELNWLTASELNNDYFIVERSEDGLIWTAFTTVDGNGTSTSASTYSVVDRNPNQGVNYYRVKQVDYDGQISFSDVITISENSNAEVNLFPNPAEDNVMISASDFFTKIQLIDVKGSVLMEQDYKSIKQTSLDISSLRTGVYYVSIQTESGVSVERLVVK